MRVYRPSATSCWVRHPAHLFVSCANLGIKWMLLHDDLQHWPWNIRILQERIRRQGSIGIPPPLGYRLRLLCWSDWICRSW